LVAGRRNCFSGTTALAGTLLPIDDQKGIPVAAFDETLEFLDKTNMEAFYVSMFADRNQAKQFLANRSARSVSSVRDELISLKAYIEEAGSVEDIYSRRIVTRRDRIFPAGNQLRAWGKELAKQRKKGSTFIFWFPAGAEERKEALIITWHLISL